MGNETTSILSLMIVTGIAFFIPIFLQRFKLRIIPVVVAEIIAGIIIGKSGMNIIDVNNAWLGLLSMLGLIYLMFLSGVEIDFTALRPKKNMKKNSSKTASKNMNPFVIATLIFTVMLAFAYGLSLLLVHYQFIEDPYFMTIILSTISLGIVVPVLKEKRMIETTLGQTILLIAVVSDFATMIIFAYYLAIRSGDTAITVWILLLLSIVFMLYLLLNHMKTKGANRLSETLQKGTAQIGTRGVFALILFFVALSETLGIENILGAFLAGVIVSLLAPNKDFIHQLDSFGYGFLIPIFFVMVGVKLDLNVLLENKSVILLIPIVLAFIYIARVTPTLLLKRWFGTKEAITAGILLSATMSLAIVASSVALEMELISDALNSAIVVVAIISCFVSPIIFNKSAKEVVPETKRISIVGASQTTLHSSLDFTKDGFDVRIFTTTQEKIDDSDNTHNFPLIELYDLTVDNLIDNGAFDCTHIIISTSNDTFNSEVAKRVKEVYDCHPIVKIENPQLYKEFADNGYTVYSNSFAARTLLKTMIHSPNLIRFLSQSEESVREIPMRQANYDGIPLRHIQFLGNVLILNIWRGDRFITPHGDTKIKLGDNLIVSGNIESINATKEKFSD